MPKESSYDLCFWYLENDGGARFLLQDTVGAERLKVRVWVVEEVGVVVDQQRLDVVEDEPELVGVLYRVQTGKVLCHQGGSEAAHAGGVQHFTHLGRTDKDKERGENHSFDMLSEMYCIQIVHISCYDSLERNMKCHSVIRDKRRRF